MTLARRVAWLVAAAVVLAMLGSLVLHLLATRQALRAELARHDQDAALSLARTLSLAPAGDLAAMQALARQHLHDAGLGRVQLQLPDGRIAFDLQAPAEPQRAPRWFVQLLPLHTAAGQTPVRDAPHGAELGQLRLWAGVGWAHDALWDVCVASAQGLAALTVLAAALALWLLRAWQRPLQAAAQQALALAEGRFVEAPEPRLPELRSLTRNMNATVRRLREAASAQAEQVQRLQRQAQFDAVTGLPSRGQFLGRLQVQLAAPGGPGAALILVRVVQLEALNRRLGHEATDRLLAGVAGLLLAYVERVAGTFAGRLNGSDFALCLPVAGVADETAASLHAALAAAPALHAGAAQIVVGGVDGLAGDAPGTALAAADAALAEAEAGAGLVVQGKGSLVADPAGAHAWHDQIAAALAEGRVRIDDFAVVGRDGRLIHLECPLRVQLQPGGDYHDAGRWLALARRSRLLPQVDLAALDLALRAIAADGRPRAVHVALPSLASAGFVADVAARLARAPQAARCLSIEWEDENGATDWQAVHDAALRWRACGVTLGVEHAGARTQQLARLGEHGVAYVKLDARHLRGAATDAAVHAYAGALVTLIHGMAAAALAEGVDDAADLQVLWALGFDGATGPAVPAPAAG